MAETGFRLPAHALPREHAVFKLLRALPEPKSSIDEERAEALGTSTQPVAAFRAASQGVMALADEWVNARSRWDEDTAEMLEALVEVIEDTTGASKTSMKTLRKTLQLEAYTARELAEEEQRMMQAVERAEAARREETAKLKEERSKQAPLRVTIIGCGKTKLPGRHRAEDLYTGNLFKATLAYAKKTSDVVWIVSARYGLLTLDQEIESYDLVITQLSKSDREAWGSRVANSILTKLMGYRFELVLLAGQEYTSLIRSALNDLTRTNKKAREAFTISEPLKGMMVGQRLQWLKQHT